MNNAKNCRHNYMGKKSFFKSLAEMILHLYLGSKHILAHYKLRMDLIMTDLHNYSKQEQKKDIVSSFRS